MKSLEPTLAPQTILTNFELAAIGRIKNEFPQISHRVCFFFILIEHFISLFNRAACKIDMKRNVPSDPGHSYF